MFYHERLRLIKEKKIWKQLWPVQPEILKNFQNFQFLFLRCLFNFGVTQ